MLYDWLPVWSMVRLLARVAPEHSAGLSDAAAFTGIYVGRHRGDTSGPGLQWRILVYSGDFHFEAALVAATDMLNLAGPPTAIFAGSDMQAMGVYEAARLHRLRIPDDLSVVGFDDLPSRAGCHRRSPRSSSRSPRWRPGQRSSPAAFRSSKSSWSTGGTRERSA
jgi:DNA-binding LacI/PurR family transcriptional regulator